MASNVARTLAILGEKEWPAPELVRDARVRETAKLLASPVTEPVRAALRLGRAIKESPSGKIPHPAQTIQDVMEFATPGVAMAKPRATKLNFFAGPNAKLSFNERRLYNKQTKELEKIYRSALHSEDMADIADHKFNLNKKFGSVYNPDAGRSYLWFKEPTKRIDEGKLLAVNQYNGMKGNAKIVLPLEEVLTGTALYDKYPNMRNVTVYPYMDKKSGAGYYSPSEAEIGINFADRGHEDFSNLLDTIMHEVTHATSYQGETYLPHGTNPTNAGSAMQAVSRFGRDIIDKNTQVTQPIRDAAVKIHDSYSYKDPRRLAQMAYERSPGEAMASTGGALAASEHVLRQMKQNRRLLPHLALYENTRHNLPFLAPSEMKALREYGLLY